MSRHLLPVFSRILTILLLGCVLLPAFAPAESVRAESGERGYDVKETILTGKKILFTGGSITEAYCERSNERRDNRYGWASRIGEHNQMKWITVAKGGASISDCRGDNTVLNQLKSKQAYSYDIILLQGGTNDAWDSVRVGTLSEGFGTSESYDRS
ncbi:MAG: SGNH/GDSL hydrolase family protein, partial [Clostridia bacterium]|nr:SGNH/GDSL hydrolase family protein [Clostridia bacterium]